MSDSMTPEQIKCAAKGHEPWVIATRTDHDNASFGEKPKRIRWCTGCGMDRPSRRKAK